MSRRLAIAGLALAFGLPALAQQAPVSPIPAAPQPAETQTNQGLGSNQQQRQQRTQQGGAPQDTQTPARQAQASAPAAMGQQQSEADRRYVQQTLAVGTVALQASNFALTKAQNPRVKMFAGFEVAEQNTLSDVLHSFAEPATTASTTQGAKQAAATAPELPQKDAAAMERMSRAQPGAAFDKDYVAMQLEGHRELLGIQERYLQSNPGNREAMNVAKLARGQIKEHLALLEDMQKELAR